MNEDSKPYLNEEKREEPKNDDDDALMKLKVRKKIYANVQEFKMLKDVKKIIAGLIGKNILSTIEEKYVEYKYVKYCKERFLSQIPVVFSSQVEIDSIYELAKKISKIFNLEDIPRPFSEINYLKILLKENHLFKMNDRSLLLLEFKRNFTNCFFEKYENNRKASYVSKFIRALTNYLSDWKSQFSDFKDSMLNWLNELEMDVNQNTLLNFIKNLVPGCKEKFLNWNDYAEQNKLQLNYFETEHEEVLKNLIASAIEMKVNISSLVTNDFNRIENELKYLNKKFKFAILEDNDTFRILEINKPILTLSSVQDEIERINLEKNLDEIRIIANSLFVDCDLYKTFWHGKNFVVLGNNVVVVGKHAWDFSGLDGKDKEETANSGNKYYFHGRNGQAGENGESGGQVYVMANNVLFSENLTITSNGGRGGDGQNGGNGFDAADGEDGIGISLEDLKARFPSPSRDGNFIRFNLYKTVASINEAIGERDTFRWSYGFDKNTGKDSTFFGGKISHRAIFLKGKTENGCQIEFSFYQKEMEFYNPFRNTCDCVFLYKGSPGGKGEKGGRGGLGGEGGKGGFGGNIQIKIGNQTTAIKSIDGRPGYDGLDGNPGRDGKPGHNGPDRGFVDSAWKFNILFSGPGKLRVCRSNDNRSDAVWYGHSDNFGWGYIENCGSPDYATMEQTHSQSYNEANKSGPVRANRAISNKKLNEKFQEMNLQGEENEVEMNSDELIQFFNKQEEILGSEIEAQIKTNLRLNSKMQTNSVRPIPNDANSKECKKNKIKTAQTIFLNKNSINDQMKRKLMLMNEIGENLGKNPSKLKYAKQTILIEGKTVEDSDSAFHALFGQKSDFGIYECNNVEERKKEFYSKFRLKNFDSDCKEFFKMSLISLFVNKKNHIDFEHMELIKLKSLNERFIENSLDWELHCNDSKLIKEYSKYLKMTHDGFLISDFAILAKLYRIEMQLYFWDELSNSFQQFFLYSESFKTSTKQFEKCQFDSNLIPIYVTQRNFFSKLEFKIVRDFSKRNEYFDRVMNTFWAKSSSEIKKLELQKFLKSTYEKQENSSIHTNKNKSTLIEQIKAQLGDIDFNKEFSFFVLNFIPVEIVSILQFRISTAKTIDQSALSAINYFIYSIQHGLHNNLDLITLKWICFAFPIHQWMDELFLLKLEELNKTYTSKATLREWRERISQVHEKKLLRLLIDKIEEDPKMGFIKLDSILTSIARESEYDLNSIDSLSELSITDWPIRLKQLKILNFLNSLKIFKKENDQVKSRVLYYLCSIQNEQEYQLEEFIKIFSNEKNISKYFNSENFKDMIGNFYNGNWALNENVFNIMKENLPNDWLSKFKQLSNETGIRDLHQIIDLIKHDKNTTIKNVIFEIEKILKDFTHISNVEEDKEIFFKTVRNSMANFNSKDFNEKKISTAEILSFIDFYIEKHFGFQLRLSQKFCILAFVLNYNGNILNQLLAQVSTGEGKSLIVVAVMIIKVLQGQSCDVITSSHILAKRDAEEYEVLYKEFGISVGHNSSENSEERRDAYEKNIVYGDVSSFQRDYLMDQFYDIDNGRKILGNRKYENVIVDEVDSMLLDKGNSVLYLSHQPPNLDALEGLFVFIWQKTIEITRSKNNLISEMENLKETLLGIVFPSISKEDLTKILPKDQIEIVFSKLQTLKIIDAKGRIQIKQSEIESKIPNNICEFYKQVYYIFDNKMLPSTFVRIPNYLKPFVEIHLERWIQSALKAFTMEENVNYTVDVDRSGVKVDLGAGITIIDLDTGIDQGNCQWNEGLHQFLQLKHGCKLTLLNLKAVFISNISYFKLYNNVMGLTGTIGSEAEREFLRSTYNVDFLTVPLAIPNQFIELEPIICQNETSWFEEILISCKLIIDQQRRSVLIICGTVKEAEELYDNFKEIKADSKWNLQIYRRSYEAFDAVKSNLEPNNLIIATNLAGRGTDIKLSKTLSQNGGLHVCLTFLPNNVRVEKQAFGRAGRKGESGTGQLIFKLSQSSCNKNDDENSIAMTAIDLKMERDTEEMQRIRKIKTYYEKVIKREEDLFGKFAKTYKKIKSDFESLFNEIERKNETVISTLLNQSKIKLIKEKMFGIKKEKEIADLQIIFNHWLLDEWAYWLDSISARLEGESDNEILLNLDALLSGVNQVYHLNIDSKSIFAPSKMKKYFQLVRGIAHIIKIGKHFIAQNDYESPKKEFDYLIEIEPEHSAPAKYYKALGILKKTNLATKKDLKKFMREIDKVELYLNEELGRQTSYSAIVEDCQIAIRNKGFIKINGYSEQKRKIINLLNIFINSIQIMRGNKNFTPQIFTGPLINEELAIAFYNHFKSQNILRSMSVNTILDEEKIKIISRDYGISFEKLLDGLQNHRGIILNKERIKYCRDQLNLPCRAKFWKILIEKKIIENEKCFAIVRKNGDNKIQSKLKETLKSDSVKVNKGGFSISLFDEDSTNCEQITTKEQVKKSQRLIEKRNNGLVVYEKTGLINIEKLKKASFDHHYSIDKLDFTQIPRITDKESVEIFQMLVNFNFIDNNGILSQNFKNNENKFSSSVEINNKLNMKYSIYQEEILGIVESKCRYRIEQLKLLEQIENENELRKCLHFSLPIRPEKSLIYNMIDEGIIKGVRVSEGYFEKSFWANFKEGALNKPSEWLKWLTSFVAIEKIQKFEIKDFFDIRISNNTIDEIWKELIRKNWISNEGEIKLELHKEPEKLNTEFEDFECTLKRELRLRKCLVKPEYSKHAFSALHSNMGSLKTIDVKDGFFQNLSDNLPESELFSNTEELNIFQLNGFDHIVAVDEKSYTFSMWLSTIGVILIGLGQIVLGTWLMVYTAGFGTFVSECLISEGISDIIYGVQAARTGHYSWRDWADHKWTSIAISMAGICIAGYIAKGVKYSKFGHKLGGDNWVTKIGKSLFKAVEKTIGGVSVSVYGEIAKSVGYNIAHALSSAASSILVNEICIRTLRSFTENLSENIFLNFEKCFEENSNKNNLKELCNIYGKKEASKIVENETQKALGKDWKNSILQTLFSSINIVIKGINMGLSKLKQAGQIRSYNIIEILQLIITKVEIVAILVEMSNKTKEFIQQMNKNILDLVSGNKDKSKNQTNDKEIAKFEEETKSFWKKTLTKEVAVEIENNFIKPILLKGANNLMHIFGNQLRGYFKNKKINSQRIKLSELSEKLKLFKENSQSAFDQDERNSEFLKVQKEILLLRCHIKDPTLYAESLKLGGPLTTTDLIAIANTNDWKIEIDSDNENLPSVINPNGKTILRLKLTCGDGVNNFGHWESSSAQSNFYDKNVQNMNCLLDAINEELRLKSIDQTITREYISSCMLNDPEFKTFVENNWARTYAAIGGFGGLTNEEKKSLFANPNFFGYDKELYKNYFNLNLSWYVKSGRDKSNPDDVTLDAHIKESSKIIVNDGSPTKKIALFKDGRTKWMLNEYTAENLDVGNRNCFNDKERASIDLHPGEQIGHFSPHCLGGNYEERNLFRQHGTINMGYDGVMAKALKKFIKHDFGAKCNTKVIEEIRMIYSKSVHERPIGVEKKFTFLINNELASTEVLKKADIPFYKEYKLDKPVHFFPIPNPPGNVPCRLKGFDK